MKEFTVAVLCLVSVCFRHYQDCPQPKATQVENKTIDFSVKFECFKGKDKKWYSNIVASNGEILFHNHQGYENKGDMLHAIDLVKENSSESKIVFK